MRSDSISYNPALFESDGGPYDSRKLQNGRPKQRSEKKRGGRKAGRKNVKNTLWLPSIAPTSVPAPYRIKQEGGFGKVNHFLQVVNSQGRRNESDLCVHIKWRHHSNTLPESTAAFLSHSSSNVEKCWTLKS